jgi:hypothetical protein
MTRRAAIDAVRPELQPLHAENQNLRAFAAQTQRANIEQALDREVPDWREIYRDPRFAAWLAEPDPYADATRSQLMRGAVANGDAGRVVRFYQGFQQTARHAPAGHPRASQSRPAAAGGNVYTRQQITGFYKQRRDGHISDADWARREADIVKAAAEGRVAGALNLTDGTEMSRLR